VTSPRDASDILAILLDIEGTTTPIAFVSDVLFPYARQHLVEHITRHINSSDYAPIFASLRTEQTEDSATERVPPSLPEYCAWLMDRDRKSTPLKELQGKIWKDGYTRGELVGQVYDDVAAAFARWQARGVGVGIFSSGSVLAQHLLFRHSSFGDLSALLDWHFDTNVGAKGDPESYRRIAETIGIAASHVLFVSDVVRELDAARTAGLQTRLAVRPGNQPAGAHTHPVVHSFDEIG
jgi:enolase-phosphatase E1